MNKKMVVVVFVIITLISLIGCSNINNDIIENSPEAEDNTQNNNENEEGKIHNWQGKIKDIKEDENKEGYSQIEWSGTDRGGSFIIEDSLVYEEYDLRVGDYIDVLAQDVPYGLKIINIKKIPERTVIKGLIEKIEIEGEYPKIYLKVSNQEMFNQIITLSITKDTKFENTIIEGLKKSDIIRAKGVLSDNILDCDEIGLISSLNNN